MFYKLKVEENDQLHEMHEIFFPNKMTTSLWRSVSWIENSCFCWYCTIFTVQALFKKNEGSVCLKVKGHFRYLGCLYSENESVKIDFLTLLGDDFCKEASFFRLYGMLYTGLQRFFKTTKMVERNLSIFVSNSFETSFLHTRSWKQKIKNWTNGVR